MKKDVILEMLISYFGKIGDVNALCVLSAHLSEERKIKYLKDLRSAVLRNAQTDDVRTVAEFSKQNLSLDELHLLLSNTHKYVGSDDWFDNLIALSKHLEQKQKVVFYRALYDECVKIEMYRRLERLIPYFPKEEQKSCREDLLEIYIQKGYSNFAIQTSTALDRTLRTSELKKLFANDKNLEIAMLFPPSLRANKIKKVLMSGNRLFSYSGLDKETNKALQILPTEARIQFIQGYCLKKFGDPTDNFIALGEYLPEQNKIDYLEKCLEKCVNWGATSEAQKIAPLIGRELSVQELQIIILKGLQAISHNNVFINYDYILDITQAVELLPEKERDEQSISILKVFLEKSRRSNIKYLCENIHWKDPEVKDIINTL